MRALTSALALSLLIVVPAAYGDDWPQWMGPRRDNVWREKGILKKFPAGGPRIVWRAPVAGGFAGPAVAAGHVFVIDFETEENVHVGNFERQSFAGFEQVRCLDAQTGREKWKYRYPVTMTVSYPAGPRCTPIVDGGNVYTLGAEGHLHCFRAGDGKVVWSKDLAREYATRSALWGYAGHPLIDGQKLICVVGGQGSHAVALDKSTGRELWRSLTAVEQGYSPPTIIEAAGVRQLILVRPDAVTSVDPETGRPYWSVPYEATSGAIIMSPVHWRDHLYVAGYSNKNLLIKLTSNVPGAEVVWRNQSRHGISPVNVQPFLDGDELYGFDQKGSMFAVALPGGERLWETSQPVSRRPRQNGTAFIVRQAERYWMFTENGELVIAKLSPEGFEEIDRARVIQPTNVAPGRAVVWSAPAFANRRMFVRNDEECVCVDLSALHP